MSEAVQRLNAALEGRYRIDREIGEGGMATVYLADDLRHERKVALKVLKPELAAVVGANRFLAEIKTTANLQHPHILPLHDSGEADGFLFYVMPYVAGESLRERLDHERQLPVQEAVQIATNVAEALDYAHRQGVIHRDIKPANILLQSGKPVVSDFGIALAVGAAGGGRLTETGLSLGTPHYMSPEQATGDAHVGPQTDIYALGCVLYEMLVGEPPYTGSTPQAILGKIITEPPAAITKTRKSVPPHVEATIVKALEKVPADRFSSALGFVTALADEGFRYGRKLAAPSPSRAGLWKGLSLALALLFGGTVVWSWQITSDPIGSPLPGVHLQLALPPGVSLPLHSDYPVLAVSPDGSRIAFVGEEGGRRRLYTRLLSQSAFDSIPDTDGAVHPLFSPDGDRIAYVKEARVYAVSTAGGASVPLHGISGEGVSRGVAWVSDTSLVSVSSANSGLLLGSAVDGRVGLMSEWDTLTGSSEPAAWPTRVGGTSDVLFARSGAGSATTDIGLFSLNTGAERTLVNRASSPRFSSTGHLLFARGSVLHAIGYDTEARETRGVEREVVSGVAMSGPGVSHYAIGGSTLAYVSGGEISQDVELVWVDRSGQVIETLDEGRRYQDPRISPDGRRVAVTVETGPNLDVWLLDLTRSTFQPLTRDPGEDFEPQWHPDGQSLALSSEIGEERGEFGPASAWIPELGGPTEQLIFTPEAAAWDFPTSWTPDGQTLVVTVRREGESSDIALFDLDGDGELIPFVDTPANEAGGRVSPDGRWLAYVSDESGRNEVWIRPFPERGVPVQLSGAGGTEPVWSWDSNELFFRSGSDMMVVEVRQDQASAFGVPTRLFSGQFERNLFGGNSANFDVSIDGERFLMVRRRDLVHPTVIDVVLNWDTVLLPSSQAGDG